MFRYFKGLHFIEQLGGFWEDRLEGYNVIKTIIMPIKRNAIVFSI